ncbi:MAG: septum formation initiator family protein [Eubacteriales bacterium]
MAAVTLFLIITIVTLQSQLSALREERDELAVLVDEYKDKVEELEYESTLSEKEYIEKYAREVLGFHKSGEIIFKKGN